MTGERCGARGVAIVLAVCHALLLVAMHAAAAQPTQCLSPAAEHTIRELFAAGTLQTTLGPDLTLTNVTFNVTRIEVRTESVSRDRYGIDLVVGPSDRASDGHGKRFAYHFSPPAPPDSSAKALLATADLIDRIVPETAFVNCAGPPATSPHQSSTGHSPPHHYPRTLALFSATVQVLILLAATISGWLALRAT